MTDIDEYACLGEWSKKKSLTIAESRQCDERYWRYLYRISVWKDEEGNDYSLGMAGAGPTIACGAA